MFNCRTCSCWVTYAKIPQPVNDCSALKTGMDAFQRRNQVPRSKELRDDVVSVSESHHTYTIRRALAWPDAWSGGSSLTQSGESSSCCRC